MAALQACCKEWDGIEAWGGVAQREWEEKRHLNQLFIIVGFYNLKCK